MNDNLEEQTDAERLQELKAELSRHFGKLSRWKALCQERDITSVEEQIRLAGEVLKTSSTGTNAEWLTYHLRLKGGKSFDVDEMLAENGPASGKDGAPGFPFMTASSCQTFGRASLRELIAWPLIAILILLSMEAQIQTRSRRMSRDRAMTCQHS